jgi:hypothetical protein
MRRIIVFVTLILLALSATADGATVWTSEELSGYYKFTFWDGNTYAFRVEQGERRLKDRKRMTKIPDRSVRIYILEMPNKDHFYRGIIKGDTIYFADDSRSPVFSEVTKSGENSFFVRALDPNTGEVREFTAERTTKEEAERITQENKVGDTNEACMQNLMAIGAALRRFANEHGEHMPSTLEELYPDYIQDKKVFVCPWHGGKFEDFEQDYHYISGINPQSMTPQEEIIVIEDKGNHVFPWRFHYELHLDGQVHAVTE